MGIVARHMRVAAAATLLMSASLSGALAQTVEAAAERLKEIVSEQGLAIDWDSVDVSGSDGVLVGVRAGTADDMVPIGDIRIDGVSEEDEGFLIESVSMERYYVGDSTGSLSVEGVEMTNMLLPNEDVIDSYGGSIFYETADIDRISVYAGGTQVFEMTSLYAEISPSDDDGSPMEFEGAAEGFMIDLSIIEEPDQRAVLQALGYERLEGYMSMAGSWQPTDGRLELSEYEFTVVDAGTLGFTFDLGGYTPDLIASLREMQKQMAANPDGDSSAQGLALLGLMQQMTFHSAEIAFADDSLTDKIVEFVAQQQGMSANDIRNQAKAILPFALAQLNNAEFTTMVTQAVSAYLDDPQSLRVRAEPASPTPFALIMAGGMTNPVDLIKTLGVTVTAND